MKFKVGDKVRVRNDITVGTVYGGYNFTGPMTKYRGCVATITLAGSNIFGKKRYHIDLDDGATGWTDEMFESLTFTKSDLKDGMVVEYRNGDRCVVINGCFIKPTGYGWMPINDYDDELYCKGVLLLDRAYDVVKVYSSKAKNMPDYCDASRLTLIWERKEEPDYTEMTVEEIEEKLGYKIKVVADK
jgi:hypothetical protein